MELNRICLPENYPDIFFREISKRYPNLFVVAEKKSELALAKDKEAQDSFVKIKNSGEKNITVEKLIQLNNQTYDEAKEILEKILKYSDNLPFPFRFFKKDFENGLSVYKIIDDSLLMGYIMCRLENGISNYKFKWIKKGHIVSIAVDEPYRKQGVGEALLKTAINEMEKAGAIEQVLEVRTTNYDAIRMYQKIGFEVVKVLKKYYHDGTDAYLMARQTKKEDS